MRGLGPTMTAWGQSIGISVGMLSQTLIMSRLDQISRLGARIQFFHFFFFPFGATWRRLRYKKHPSTTLWNFTLKKNFNLWKPCVLYIGQAHRYPPNTPFCIFFQQLYILNFLNMQHTLCFFLSSKCHLFYNGTFFGSCIIRILHTECAKI
jgi:hypothetical protein